MKHIFLYGPPGTGKTSVGKVLADRLHCPFIDLDFEMEKSAGQSISKIMKEKGETAFRDLETETLKKVVNDSPCVIALGGGALLRTENRRSAEGHGQVVFLDAKVNTLFERLQKSQNQRPLLDGNLKEKLQALLGDRKDHYDSFPIRINQQVESNHDLVKNPQQIALEIQQTLCLMCVRLPDGNFYSVTVQPGGLNSLGSLLREQNLQGPVAIISDEVVAKFYAEQALRSIESAGYRVQAITFPAGENSKNIDTVMYLWQQMLRIGLDRKSNVVALGGGVTGDLAGFAASAFMRGINWIGVPTTLLAMVDSSLGGKTGFDLPEGKNLIGSFHSPKLVLADPLLLNTLPEMEFISGMAEVVKHGAISDPELFYLCQRGLDWIKNNLEEVVKRAMSVKIRFIEEDPYEKGLRASLNFGHTVGHAVELVSHFQLRHGEAVAIGMVTEAKLAERLAVAEKGLSDTISESLLALHLPIRIPKELPRENLIHAMRMDKKKNAEAVRFALPVELGKVALVDVTDLESVLEDA